jgi:hypothetical protein
MKYILIPTSIFLIIFCKIDTLIASQNYIGYFNSRTNICNISIDNDSKPINDTSRTALEIAREYADSYSPTRESNKGIAELPDFSDSVKKAFQSLEKTSFKDFERNIVLIFIKIYSAHLECCHQSYDLRITEQYELYFKNEPLLEELNKLTKKYKEGVFEEFIPSNIGYDYVKSHRYLLKDEQIKEHYDRIEVVLKNIEDGVYWKD